ncbi:TPA: hypothetical protein L5597_004146 [Pseudomonas aeruginosa]|uniref:HNH endonuclease n=1 Tax=Pseudomonas aeruginosa TaxID=287 RepID=UPI000B493729|nr:HNH endonuclease [Pseudomonas aeruginosa]MBI7359785.1 HNH endonuclease [Pseudomonas aeruginosa]MCS8361528.1 HNH endonuclease [Pseudomonas aeruginosa]MCS8644872.1 HNH endonuclease [Pseudomonas aeruginosa]MDJ1309751.1 HNH endonuclease [Pseudomonas aeruginosa]OWI29601.1 hypothetical protein CDC11_00445 [Pseudomonas aeruginosa]
MSETFTLEMDDAQRSAFWSKVGITWLKTDCWEWQGARKPKGYGNCTVNKESLGAHRVAFWLSNGDFPANMHVCHTCDNPSCCNPSHLMLGTVDSNYIDMLIKGRSGFTKNRAIGTRNANAKLTDQQVSDIRRAYASGEGNQYELAARYGVSQAAIGSILRNKTWRHVA